jgi:hypothetical protein
VGDPDAYGRTVLKSVIKTLRENVNWVYVTRDRNPP